MRCIFRTALAAVLVAQGSRAIAQENARPADESSPVTFHVAGFS